MADSGSTHHQQFKQQLLEEKGCLEGVISSRTLQVRDSSDREHKHASGSDVPTTDHDDNIMMSVQVAHHRLARVKGALARIEAGTYGTCRCGEEIPHGRLVAEVTSTQCISCVEKRGDPRMLAGVLVRARAF